MKNHNLEHDPKNKSIKKLIILPLDGVVVETNHAFWPAIKDLLEANDVKASEINTELLNLLTGMSVDQMVGHIRERFDLLTSRRQLVEQFTEFVSARLATESFAVDGFDQFLKTMQEEDLTVAVRTGTPAGQLEILDGKFGLTKTFGSNLFCSDKVEKVGEKFVAYIINKLGFKAKDCIVVFKKQKDADFAAKKGFHAISMDYKKSVGKDGKIVASLKPFEKVLEEIHLKL